MVDLLMVLYVKTVSFGDLICLMNSCMRNVFVGGVLYASSTSLFNLLDAGIIDASSYYRVRRCGMSSFDGPCM